MIFSASHHQWKMQWKFQVWDKVPKMIMINKCTKMPQGKLSLRIVWKVVIFQRKLSLTLIEISTTTNWVNRNVSQHATMPKSSFILATLLLKEKIFIGILQSQREIIKQWKTSTQIEECIRNTKKVMEKIKSLILQKDF